MDKKIKQLIKDGGIILANLPSGKEELLETISDKGDADKFVKIVNNGKSPIKDILNLYEEDARHLEFMAGDVDELVLEKSDDAEYVKFAIKHYTVNISWVQSQLLGGELGKNDGGSASLMIFNLIIDSDQEPELEDYEIIMFGESDEEEYYSD